MTNAAAAAAPGVTNTAASAALAETTQFIAAEASLADWILQGGIMMIPLFLCAIAALAIIIERTFSLRRIRLEAQDFTEKITRIVRAGKITEAEIICENTPGPMASVIKAALAARERSGEEVRVSVEEAAERESRSLERYLPALGTIGTVSPLLGLLGTVLGMIKSSNFLAVSGSAQTAGLIGGISEALITTAAGLFVAIPAVVCHSWFTNKVNGIILDMEAWTNDILALFINGPRTRAGGDAERGDMQGTQGTQGTQGRARGERSSAKAAARTARGKDTEQ